MKFLYANLVGEWVNISEKDNIVIDNNYTDASMWIKEQLQSLNDYSYIHLTVDNVDYRIHPSQIQIVTK